MQLCPHCGRQDHNQWNCPVKKRADLRDAKEDQHHKQIERETRAARHAAERSAADQRTRLAEERRHRKRIEADAREQHEKQLKREELYEASSRQLHEWKRRASALRRSESADATRAWLQYRLLAAEARLSDPTDFHPAQQSEFTDFLDAIDDGIAAAETALGPDVRSAHRWVQLRRERGVWLNAVAERLESLDERGMDADDAPLSLTAVEEQLAAVRANLQNYGAHEPPQPPAAVLEYYRATDPDVRRRSLAQLPAGTAADADAQHAWNYLAQTQAPRRPRTRSPSSTAARTAATWVGGIGVIFLGGALYTVDGAWPDRLYVGAVAYSPIGAVGLMLTGALAFFSRRARQAESDDEARFERELEQYSRAVVAVVVRRERFERLLELARARERVLQRLAKHYRAIEAFDADPQRGGHLRQLEEQRPDLEELVAEVSVFDALDEGET